MDTETTSEATVTKDDIQRALRTVGIEKQDIAFVHSSLSSFGHVKGGADTVIDALLETVGDYGTIVVPTFTWGHSHDKEKVVFDTVNAPCETGRIPEAFRMRNGAIRSVHICHSIAAMGPHAHDVMGEGIRSFGEGSSFDCLHRLNAWNLFLGVSFSVCTALHMVEEFMRVPYRAYRNFKGSEVILPDRTQIPSASVEYLPKEGYSNDFEKMGNILSEEGVLKTCNVGQARIINVRIKHIFEVTKRCLEKDIGFLLAPECRSQLIRTSEQQRDKEST